MTKMRVPIFPYPGGKGRLARTLVSMMPQEGTTYVEPFAGRGNVFFAAALNLNFQAWVINDLRTSRFFEALIKRGSAVTVPQRTQAEFNKQKRCFRKGSYRAELLAPYLTFAGGGYKRGSFGNLRGANRANYTQTLRDSSRILTKIRPTIQQKDWKELDWSTLDENAFVYFDPPYLGCDVRAYSSACFDYGGLIRLLKSARFKWMLSEYDKPLYLRAFGKPFCTLSVQLICDGKGEKQRNECVWKNY
jgi:site-specific DNA-adenine methylase